MSSLIAFFSASGRVSILLSRSPQPLLRLTLSFFSVSACFLRTSSKNTETTWPKMMGSEIFIIVALTCSENSRPCFLATSICSAKNLRKALALMADASITSPACSGVLSFSTVTLPSLATCSMRALVAAGQRCGNFRTEEVAVLHVGNVGLGILAPCAHLVRIVAGKLLDGGGGAAVRIAFTQNRVDGAAQHDAVTGADILVGVGGYGCPGNREPYSPWPAVP